MDFKEAVLKGDFIRPQRDFGDVCHEYYKGFQLNKDVKSAELAVTARGVYAAYINNKRVGDFILAPGWCDPHYSFQVQRYDVTEYLMQNNEITVTVAGGWYCGKLLFNHDKNANPEIALIAELKIIFSDGSEKIYATGKDWSVRESTLRFSDIYDGMVFDANFTAPYKAVKIADDNDKTLLIEQIGEKVTEHERIKPISVIKTPKGETVIDFGQNLTGYPEIHLTAKKGDKVDISFAEILDKDGNFYNENYRSALCKYEYICRDGEQTYKPELTFYGFRYIRLNEYPTEINPDDFTAICVYSDIKRTGYIETSDPMLNQLVSNIIWGQKCNYLDVPTDCPQRDERMGWTGDAQVFSKAATYNFDVDTFLRKWLRDVKLCQEPDGCVINIVPKFGGGGSAAWGDAITVIPWQLYLSYADRDMLQYMFDGMCKWVDFITATTEKPGIWLGGCHFGDWLELKVNNPGDFVGNTRKSLIATAFYAYSTSLVCKAGEVLKKDVSRYKKLYGEIVEGFKNEFKGEFHTQTEYILPLWFDLTDTPQKHAAELAELIHSDGDKLQTGFVGTPYLMHVLHKFGYDDLAYDLLLRKEYPSWLYPVTKGATTMWEHWDGIMPDGSLWNKKMNSFNHYAYGAVIDWLYGVCGGINPVEAAPGYEKVMIAPTPTDKIDWFRVKYLSKHGEIISNWRHENGKTVYEITTPVDATVIIDGKTYEVTAGEYTF